MKVWISRFLIVAVIAVLVGVGATTAVAQSPSFSDFSSSANLTRNGNAVIFNGNVLRLNPAAAGQKGSAWFNILQPVAGGFTTTFTFQITDANPTTGNFPADGLAFVIQNSAANTAALGQDGGAIGYGGAVPPTPSTLGIENSLAVEFDTFANSWDPESPSTFRANHVAVQSCGPEPNTADHTASRSDNVTSCKLGINASPIDLADGNPHIVKIEYTPSSFACDCSSNIRVTVDNIFVLQVNVDLSTFLNLANPSETTADSAYVGFTAATGALIENNDILNWTFTPHTSSSVNNITVPPGGTGVASFGSFNYKIHNTTNGTMNFSVKAIPIPSGTTFPPNFTTSQCIVYDGTGGNCWEFEATCNSGTCFPPNNFELATSYDSTGFGPPDPFPSPGFLRALGTCGTNFTTNQITEFLVQRQDPTTKGGSGGLSCWVATTGTPTPYAATVQQPINSDGSSVFNAKKGVVPVKFTLANNGSATCNLPPATIAVTRTAGGALGAVDESLYTMSADSGTNFRVSGCQYMYNLGASAMGTGTYRVDIFIAGSKVGSAVFALK
jgi:hypothetical protein